MKFHQKEKGFTIIEVVLVLAIAALIFLMVFIALPALQRSQRDTARKSDVGIVSSAVSTYTGNNQGKFPAAGTTSLGNYVTNKSDNTSTITVSADRGAQFFTVVDGEIRVTQQSICDSTDADGKITLKVGTIRQYTVTTRLEEGSGAGYCQNN